MGVFNALSESQLEGSNQKETREIEGKRNNIRSGCCVVVVVVFSRRFSVVLLFFGV